MALSAAVGCGNGNGGSSNGGGGAPGSSCTSHDQCANINCQCSASLTVNNACFCDSQGQTANGDCTAGGTCAGPSDCTTLCAEVTPSCQAQTCSISTECPQQSCACASDGILFNWRECTAGCCVDRCPGPTGPVAPGQQCLTNCACASGICSGGLCS